MVGCGDVFELAIAENVATLKDVATRERDAAERKAEGNELEEDLAQGRRLARIVAERDGEGCASEAADLERGEERALYLERNLGSGGRPRGRTQCSYTVRWRSSSQVILVHLTLFSVFLFLFLFVFSLFFRIFLLFVPVFAVAILAGDDISEFLS